MTNVYKDLLNLNARNTPKVPDLNKGLATQGSLAKMRYEVGSSVPTASDDDANMFNTMRSQLGNAPMRGWRAAVSGILSGLELGSKSSANAERREMARKMMDTFSSLEGIANEASKRNQNYAKQAALQEQITPELEALTKNIKALPYDDVLKTGTELVERINKSSNTNYKISMIDQQNGRVLLTEPGKPDQKYDLFNMFPKVREEQNIAYLTKKAMQTQEAQDQRAEQQLRINQQNADMIQDRLEFAKDPNAQHDVTLGKEQAKAAAKAYAKLSEQSLELEDVAYKIQDLKDMLKNDEVITGSTLGAGFERLIGKQLGTKAYSDTELYDSISQGLLSFVKGNLAFGNMNQKEFEFLTNQTPGSHKTKAALTRMLSRFEATLDRQMKRNERELNTAPSYGTRSQTTQDEQFEKIPTPSQQSQSQPLPQAQPQQSDMVRMIAPDGTAVLIPARNVDLAISQGAKLGAKLVE